MSSNKMHIFILLGSLFAENLQLPAMEQQVRQMRHEPLVVAHVLAVMHHLMHIVLHHFEDDAIQMLQCGRRFASGFRPTAQPSVSERTELEIFASWFGVE